MNSLSNTSMYSKEESKQLMHEFWEKFDHYTKFYGKKMLEPIKWMFYKTGIKGLELKFEIDKKKVMVVLEVNAKNENRRFDIYVFLNEYRSIIEYGVAETLIWEESYALIEGKTVSRIFCEKAGLNFHNREHWPAIFEFMASSMLQLQNNLIDVLPIMQEKFGR